MSNEIFYDSFKFLKIFNSDIIIDSDNIYWNKYTKKY